MTKYNCDSCNYSTDDTSNWTRHKRSAKHQRAVDTGCPKKSFKCDKCQYATQDKSNFNKHVKTHNKEEDRLTLIKRIATLKGKIKNLTMKKDYDPEIYKKLSGELRLASEKFNSNKN